MNHSSKLHHYQLDALRKMFPDISSDVVTPDEIYDALGRDPSKSKQSRVWLTNRLTALKRFGLVRPIYGSEHPKKLERVQLTTQGKLALEPPTITLESIAVMIKEFERRNPSIKVELSVRSRE